MSRVDYLLGRKAPQVKWLVERARAVVNDLRKYNSDSGFKSSDKAIHLLDVGGGRGDLAMALALGLADLNVIVTIAETH